MEIRIPHRFSKGEARSRVERALNDARNKLAGQATIEREEWQGDTLHFAFSAQGQAVSGTFEVGDAEFVLNAKLPLMLRIFEGRIKAAIEEQTRAMLK